jgi:glycosyltransferase involved in cell wall biosynthesis
MTILINTLNQFSEDGKSAIILRLINRLIKEQPENKYIILSNQTGESESATNGIHTKNTTGITISKPVKDERLSRLRYKEKVRKLIKKSQADLNFFIDPYFSFSGISQILLLPDCNFFHSKKRIKEIGAQLKSTLPFQPKKILRNIVVNSEYEKQLFATNKLCPSEKIIVVEEDIFSNTLPVGLEKRENVKETFADGNEYFLYSGPVENSAELITTLKAFSAFKKRQLSSMQLVITGYAGSTYEEYMINLQSYKFKDDVKIFTELSSEENESILSSAYACIIPFVYTPSLQLFYFLVQAEVPMIAPTEGTFADKKVAHFTPGNFQDLAIKMLNIFKDENLRKSIIQSARISSNPNAQSSLSVLLKNS